ncbi:MAG: TerC family protein [Sandaracinaceae bacterium]
MPALSETTLWIGFLVFLVSVLGIDLFVFHRKTRVVTFTEALTWTVVWAVLAMLFAGLVYALPNLGPARAREFITGYVLEQALSVDNLFVFVLVFGGFAVPAAYQHRVLFWGILGAIVLRGIFILAGAAVVERFHWVLYLFGAFLLYTGVRLLFQGDGEEEDENIHDNKVVKLVRRFLPVTEGYRHEAFFVRENGALMATPLFLVLVVIELSDLIFAVDSIPTIFGVTTHGFIVFTSNMFAILGLRSIYIVLERLLPMFRFLEKAIAIILVFIAVKILIRYFDIHVSETVSLAVVLTLLVGSVVLSKLLPEKPEAKKNAPKNELDATPAQPRSATASSASPSNETEPSA